MKYFILSNLKPPCSNFIPFSFFFLFSFPLSGKLELIFWFLTTHTQLKWNYIELWDLRELFSFKRKRWWAESSVLTWTQSILLCLLRDHHNATDTSFDGAFSKRLPVATWPPRRTGMWDTSSFICSQPLKPDPVTNIRALLCLNKHPEHWMRLIS